MRGSIAKFSSVAAVAVFAAGASLTAPSAGADTLTDCVMVAKFTSGVDGKFATKFEPILGHKVDTVTGFLVLQRQIEALNQPEGTPRPQVVEASKKQIALLHQEKALMLAGAGTIKDPELSGVVRDNAEAIGAYADAFEKLLPYSQDNPPPDDLKAAYQDALDHKHETGEAMTNKVESYCDLD